MNDSKRGLVWFGAVLGVSLIVAVVIVSYVIYYVKTYNNAVITVTGVATKELKSDDVKWRSNISENTGPATSDLKSGSAAMQNDLNEVLAYFAQNGVATSDITISPLVVDPVYQTANGSYAGKFYSGMSGTLSGYNLSQDILIESTNVDGITALAQSASQYLVGKGIVFSSQDPEYYIQNSTLDAMREQMLAEALLNAKTQAQAITEDVGAAVGNLRSSSVGVTQITPVNSTQVSDYGAQDTTSVNKLITYLVHATFTMR